jgi:hypothetical protein
VLRLPALDVLPPLRMGGEPGAVVSLHRFESDDGLVRG